MIIAIDVYYYNDKAKAVGVLFEDWTSTAPAEVISAYITDIADYESGSFYKRELPCITELLKKVDINKIKCIVVDGYVFLNDEGKHGLGYYLYEYLGMEIPVVGVAKTSFYNNTVYVANAFRGESKTPLYITATGMDLTEAKNNVEKMYGEYRMPALLKMLDQQTRIE